MAEADEAGRAASGALGVRIRREPHARDLPLPQPATPGSAGLDLHAAVDGVLRIAVGARLRVPTGIALELPPGYEAQIRPRSGLALRHGILLPNAPATIDADYRGEIQVILWNLGDEVFEVQRGDRIAQLVIASVCRIEWQEVETLGASPRGTRGFGHSGRGLFPVPGERE